MPDSRYNVNIVISSKDQSSGPARKATAGMLDLKKAAAAAAMAYGALRTAQKAVDFVKTGAEIQRQAAALDNLARAAGTSADAIVGSIRAASQYTIDSMTAMSVANRALVMGVAQTPQEFEKLTETAVSLGRAMGMDATQSIDKFVLAIGRQSRLIADDFGIIMNAEQAYEDYAASINTTADALTNEQKRLAFGAQMMEQASEKVAILGGVTMDAAGKFESISASIEESKNALALFAIAAVETGGTLDWLTERATLLPNTLTAIATTAWAAAMALYEIKYSGGDAEAATDAFQRALIRMVEAGNSGNESIEILRFGHYALAEAVDEATAAIQVANGVSANMAQSMGNMAAAMTQATIAAHFLANGINRVNAAAEGVNQEGPPIAKIVEMQGSAFENARREGQKYSYVLEQNAYAQQVVLKKAQAAVRQQAEAAREAAKRKREELAEAKRQEREAKAASNAAAREAAARARDNQAAIKAELKDLAALERAAQRAAQSYWNLAQSLKDADIELAAKAMKDKLNAQLEAGTISIEKYNRAMNKLMVGAGLATPGSIGLATGLDTLIDAFVGGDLLSRELVEALRQLVSQTTGGTTNNTYNVNDPTAGALFGDQVRRDARASYAQSAGGG